MRPAAFVICLNLLLIPVIQNFGQIRAVVAIGSSTTYGLNATPRDSSWVNRLRFFLKDSYDVDYVYNLGLSGSDCYNGMPDGFQKESRPDPLADRNISHALNLLSYLDDPSEGLVIVNYPSNNYQTYSIEEILMCLQTIFDKASQAGHLCFVTTTQPRADQYFDTPELKRKLAVIKDSIIQRFGPDRAINFYDGMYNPNDSTILDLYSSGDEVHFNNAGHYVLFQRMKEKLPPANITAIEDGASAIHVFPNPFMNTFTIDGMEGSVNEIQIINPLGQLVFTKIVNASDDQLQMELSSYPPGPYVMIIRGGHSSRHLRLVKR